MENTQERVGADVNRGCAVLGEVDGRCLPAAFAPNLLSRIRLAQHYHARFTAAEICSVITDWCMKFRQRPLLSPDAFRFPQTR